MYTSLQLSKRAREWRDTSMQMLKFDMHYNLLAHSSASVKPPGATAASRNWSVMHCSLLTFFSVSYRYIPELYYITCRQYKQVTQSNIAEIMISMHCMCISWMPTHLVHGWQSCRYIRVMHKRCLTWQGFSSWVEYMITTLQSILHV